MARTFINLGLQQPAAANDTPLAPRGPSTPGIVVEGAPAAVIEQLSGRRDLVQLTLVNDNGSTKPVWVNPTYVRLIAEAFG